MENQFTPAYYQIKQDIKEKIASGTLKPGELLPGRIRLAEEYGCSWGTLNRAVNELILEGVLTAQKGKGTFVAHSEVVPVQLVHDPVKVWVCRSFPSVYATISELMDGLRSEAHRRGRGIQFIDNGADGNLPADLNGYIVVVPSDQQYEYLVNAWEQGQRFVVLNSDFNNAPFVSVNADIFNASLQVVQYLISQGHQHIGLLGLRKGFANYRHRKEAYIQAYKNHNLPYSTEWFVESPEEHLDAKDLFSDWFDRHPECTAVYAADYTSAVAILEALAERGIPFPEKISLFASGHVPFASMLKVSLCTVLQPFYELGRSAMSKLLDEQWDAKTDLKPCKLVYGESVQNIEQV